MIPRRDSAQLRALPTFGLEVVGGGVRVVTRHHGDIQDLFEGVPPCLAVLELNEVEHLVLALEYQIVEAQQHGRTFFDGCCGPGRLDRTGPRCSGRDIGGRAPRNVSEHLARHRVADVETGTGVDGLDPAGQLLQ